MRSEIAERAQVAPIKAAAATASVQSGSNPLTSVLKLISSLRLTVVCLCLAVLLVFVGTLAQKEEGNFGVQKRYFQSLFVTWTPTGTALKIPLPGGYLLGGILLVNLLAAHATRFKFTKKKIGIFVIHAGIVLLIVGQFATDILSNESALHLFEGESKNYSEDFHANELVLVDASAPDQEHIVSIPESVVAKTGEIRDSRLPVTLRIRDYWRNCDVQDRAPSQAINPGADHGAYTNMLLLPLPDSKDNSQQARAAALVEVMSGPGSLGTFLVPTRSQERQTFRFNNADYSISFLFAPMMGGNQLVLSGGKDVSGGMISFPESEVAQKGELKRDKLPVTLKVKEFWPNCRLYSRPGQGTVVPEVTAGALTDIQVTETPLVTDTDHRNLPGATVEVIGDSGSLGTYFVYTGVNARQQFFAKGKAWEIALRVKRHYYPFTVTLLKATHETYRGRQDIPKNFASLLRVDDPKANEARETKISMNKPLRYAGMTFFQYQMTAGEMAQREGVRPSSVLQVVHNPGWRTPYISCIMVAGGLLIQFLSHLIGFARKQMSS
jgi:hypothetical protein